jgi:hypothetical protein
MTPIPQPETIKVYQLLKMTGLQLIPAGTSTSGLGAGFYTTLNEAEMNRSVEMLRDPGSTLLKTSWHIFELDLPNPAYQK